MRSAVEVAWLDAVDIVRLVEAGELDRQAVARAHLERIAELDPRIHAYVHVDPAARAGSGLLGGATLAVKDAQPVAGMPWTYGTPVFKDRVADSDAIPVARARAEGAAILGKVNLPELAAAIGTTNELFPATQNPWREGYSPGGSSGGSGAAVAAGLATLAYGDDLGGSIRIPSSNCGTVGLRPSPARVPTELPDGTGYSSRGPMARSVRDVRLLFGVMVGEQPPPRNEPHGLRIALATSSPLGVDDACRDAAVRAAAALEAIGHRCEEVPWDPAPVAEGYGTVRRASIASFPARPEELGAGVRRLALEGHEIKAVDYLLALQQSVASARRNVSELFERGFDALLSPTLGLPPLPIDRVPSFLGEDWKRVTEFVLPVSFSGHPAVSLPAGLHNGLPIGVQLAGAYRREWELLDLAAQLEAADGFGFRRPPGLT